MDKILTDVLIISIINKILAKNNTGVKVYKFQPDNADYPKTSVLSESNEIEAFDEATPNAIHTKEMQLETTNVGQDDVKVAVTQDTIYYALHQKISDFTTEAGGDWKFHAINVTSTNIAQTYGDAGNPNVVGLLSLKIVYEYIGTN